MSDEDFSDWLLRAVSEAVRGERELGPLTDRRTALENAANLLETVGAGGPALNERMIFHTNGRPEMSFRNEIERRVSELENEFGVSADGADDTQYVQNSVMGEYLPDGDGSTGASNGDREDPCLDIVNESTMGERVENEGTGSGPTDFVGGSSFMGE